MISIDFEKPAKEIVAVLHENKIPMVFIPKVFAAASELAEMHTIHYKPNLEDISDLAIDDITSSATEPKG